MKTILATAYAINPYKGSEDGMGWNFVSQIARFNHVIAVTRKNNRDAIEKYIQENPSEIYQNIDFLYFDLPYWMRFWKKGGRGAMLYYYFWQLFMVLFLQKKKIRYDLIHNVNFHNDWTPSLLWMTGKPFVWGPVGHHPAIPRFLLDDIYGRKALFKDRLTWLTKQLFWNFDVLLRMGVMRSKIVLAMNSDVADKMHVAPSKIRIFPSVGSEKHATKDHPKHGFEVLSIGRFVPLKGFDMTIKAFATFYHQLSKREQQEVKLTLVGDGPYKEALINMAYKLHIEHAVTFIAWIEREKLAKIYQRASLFLFPSHEGAGMVVSEAMSYGLPVVCLDNSGPGEFVNHACGLKVNEKSYSETITALADHVTTLYTNKRLRNRLSKGARARFNAIFDWNRKGEQLADIYKEVLHG